MFQEKVDPTVICPFGLPEQKCNCSIYSSESRIVKPTRAPVTTGPPATLSPANAATCVSIQKHYISQRWDRSS